ACLAAVPAGAGKDSGIKLGEAVAAEIVARRAHDGSDAADAYRPNTKPGLYVPTPITASSMWPNVTPFALKSPTQFRPEPPIPLESQQWAADYNEIKRLAARQAARGPQSRPRTPASG